MQALTEKETTILKFLYHAFPESVTKDELLAEVWGLQNGVTTHARNTYLSAKAENRAADQQFDCDPTQHGYRLKL